MTRFSPEIYKWLTRLLIIQGIIQGIILSKTERLNFENHTVNISALLIFRQINYKMQDFKPKEIEVFNMDWQDLLTSELYQAIHKCNEPEVKRFIKSGIDVNTASKNGMTALHFASQVNNPNVVEILELLLNAGANVNATAKDGTTPLHWAVLTNNFDSIKVLLDHRADINCREKISNFTPLHLAAYIGSDRVIKLLINRGARVDQTAKDGVTPLHLASIKGCLNTVKILVNYGASVHRLTKFAQYTMLHLALMDHKEDVNKIINADDNRSECSSYLKSIEVIGFGKREYLYRYLVDQGININKKDNFGKTATHFAACCYFNRAVRWILLLGGNLHLKDNEGHLPFHYALKNDNIRGLWDFIQFGADINDVNVIKSLIPQIMTEKSVGLELTRHLIRLKTANLFIASVYKPYVNVNVHYVYYRHCLMQLAKLRNFYIADNISVYNLLHMGPKSRQLLVENLKLEFNNFKYVAPIYAGIIEASFREIVYWNSIVRSAVPAFNTIVGFHLPDLCVVNILSFLDSYTLRTIIEKTS